MPGEAGPPAGRPFSCAWSPTTPAWRPPPRRPPPRRRGLEENEGWVDVKVVNRCSEPVVFKAGYNFWKGVDEGHPCPNKGPGSDADLSVCTTDWLTIE